MKTVALDVRAPSESMGDFVRAWKTGKPEKSARISFATPELLWKVSPPGVGNCSRYSAALVRSPSAKRRGASVATSRRCTVTSPRY